MQAESSRLMCDTPLKSATLNKDCWQNEAMEAQRKTGRPSKGYGPRHTVAVQLTPEEFEIVQQIAAELGTKPGPYLTARAQEHLANLDLHEYLNQQEALPFDKVG